MVLHHLWCKERYSEERNLSQRLYLLIIYKSYIKNLLTISNLRLFLLIIFISCNESLPPQPERLGFDYLPLQVGESRIYQVELINYNLDGTSDTIYYQLKEEVVDSLATADETSYRLNRYHREDELQPWVIDSVWTARINTYQAIIVENNIPIIKLSFPVKEDRRWDGNAMNARDFDEFKMVNVDKNYLVDDQEYLNSLEMFKEDLLDPLKITNDNYHLEVFSKGIGLIYKLDIDKKYCNPVDCPEPGIILEGKVVEQKLIEFDKVE